jgi:prolipoprotein diacylglyceryl transferase
VHFYALFILAGIIIAILIANRRLVKRGATSGAALDISLWAVPFGIIGGRIFHVITHPNDYFYEGADLTAVLRIWEGGLAIYGALALGAVGAWLGARSTGVRFTSFLDAVAPGVLIAQALGRWGNYFNNELFGTPTDLPSGLPAGVLFHPTFIYESIWSLAGAAALLLLDRKFELRWGKLFALYLVFYSTGRLWIEAIRIDPSEYFLGLRTNIWSALLGIALGLVIFFLQRRRHPGLETTVLVSKNEKSLDETADAVDSKLS